MRDIQSMRAEVYPSQEAVKIIESLYPSMHDRMLLMARSGSHNFNKYHNTLHELQHVYYAWSCYVNEASVDQKEGQTASDLVMASLFHDHNHSGGMVTDDKNIERATTFLKREWNVKDPILNLIRVTQFTNGQFPIGPETLAEQCMRDADLMTIYSREGQRLVIGLFEEMSKKNFGEFTEDEVLEMLSKNENFLWKHEMFTEHGTRMKNEHLLHAIRRFESYAWQNWEFERPRKNSLA